MPEKSCLICNKPFPDNHLFQGTCQHIICTVCLTKRHADFREKEVPCQCCGKGTSWESLKAGKLNTNVSSFYCLEKDPDVGGETWLKPEEITNNINEVGELYQGCTSSSDKSSVYSKMELVADHARQLTYSTYIRKGIAAKLSQSGRISFDKQNVKIDFDEFKFLCDQAENGNEGAIGQISQWISLNWLNFGCLGVMLDYITSMVLLPATEIGRKKMWIKVFLEHLKQVTNNQNILSNQLCAASGSYESLCICIFKLLRDLFSAGDRQFEWNDFNKAIDGAFSNYSSILRGIKGGQCELAYKEYIDKLRRLIGIASADHLPALHTGQMDGKVNKAIQDFEKMGDCGEIVEEINENFVFYTQDESNEGNVQVRPEDEVAAASETVVKNEATQDSRWAQPPKFEPLAHHIEVGLLRNVRYMDLLTVGRMSEDGIITDVITGQVLKNAQEVVKSHGQQLSIFDDFSKEFGNPSCTADGDTWLFGNSNLAYQHVQALKRAREEYDRKRPVDSKPLYEAEDWEEYCIDCQDPDYEECKPKIPKVVPFVKVEIDAVEPVSEEEEEEYAYKGRDSKNVGLALMAKSGYKPGQGLGKNKSGILNPVLAEGNDGSGLGAHSKPTDEVSNFRQQKSEQYQKKNQNYHSNKWSH
uniref:RING-type domain-containing protein n=1 Tax=Rhabditophanes sp. KR3021 TaxID=114890 RepID=A0AC35TYV3_9BILA